MPNTEHYLVNAFGLTFDEVTASNLVKVDLQGNVLDGSPYQINPAGFTIHSAIHEVRHDAQCVIHLHTKATIGCGHGTRWIKTLESICDVFIVVVKLSRL